MFAQPPSPDAFDPSSSPPDASPACGGEADCGAVAEVPGRPAKPAGISSRVFDQCVFDHPPGISDDPGGGDVRARPEEDSCVQRALRVSGVPEKRSAGVGRPPKTGVGGCGEAAGRRRKVPCEEEASQSRSVALRKLWCQLKEKWWCQLEVVVST